MFVIRNPKAWRTNKVYILKAKHIFGKNTNYYLSNECAAPVSRVVVPIINHIMDIYRVSQLRILSLIFPLFTNGFL
jgi:hypothetical protein